MMNAENISEELEDWIVNSLQKLNVTVPKLKKVRAQVYKQNHKVPTGKVFGVMLSQQLGQEPNENETIPKFLLEATSFLIPHLDHKCLFRKRGQDSRIKQLRKHIEAGGTLDKTVFVDDVATLLKAWLRELPIPVIPNEFHDFILNCHKLCIEGKTSTPLILACSLLPKPHLDTLKFLLDFLARVAWNSVANCMDSQSLSIVFGPNLIRGDCKLLKNEKASAQALKEKEVNERSLLQWLIEHSEEISKLPESVQLSAAVSNGLEEDLMRKKRRKSMSGFTELVGCKIKKMVTNQNQDKTPTLSNSSRRKSLRKSQRAKGKLFVQNGDKKIELDKSKKVVNENAGISSTKTVCDDKTTPPNLSTCCSPLSRTIGKPNNKTNIVIKVNTPVTRSQSSKALQEIAENKSNKGEAKITIIKIEKFENLLQTAQEGYIAKNTPLTRSQSFKKLQTGEFQQSHSLKRRSRSVINVLPTITALDSLEINIYSELPCTPKNNEASEIVAKISKMDINSSVGQSGSSYQSRIVKSATLKRGRPNTVKTGLSLTRKTKVRSNSSVSYKINGSIRRIKVARRSRSSSNFSITEIDSNLSPENENLYQGLELIPDSEPDDHEEIKKKLDFSNSIESKLKDSICDSNANELYCSLGFSPAIDQNIEKSIPSLFDDKSRLLEEANDDAIKKPDFFKTPIESPIFPASQPRTRSKAAALSSTPAISKVRWQDAAEFNFSKSREDDDIQGSKRDSIIKLREMNAGKVLASVHLYNTIEQKFPVKPSPGTKFDRNGLGTKSVRDRKELFKDAQGFVIPANFPSSIKRPTHIQRMVSRTPDSPMPRNWHKKKNASADLLYAN